MRDLKKFPLQIGVIGCGSFLQRRILPALKEIESIRIVCIQNRDREKAQKIAEQYGIPSAVSRRDELLANPAVEAVQIASPNFLHEEDALACAAARKPTLCEKPLSTSPASVEKIILAFQQQETPLLVGHQMRLKPAVLTAKQLFQDGAFGKVLHIRAFYYSQPLLTDSWRGKKELGGGALLELGIHLVDLIHFLTDDEIDLAQALALPTEEVELMVSLQGRLKNNGALLSIECAFERGYYTGFEIIGTKARLVSANSLRQASEPKETLTLFLESGKKIDYPLPSIDLYAAEFAHFAEAVVHKIPSVLKAEHSKSSLRVIDRAHCLLQSFVFE